MKGLIGAIALVSCIWVIYDVWSNQPQKNTNEKLLWTISALLFNIITAVLYFIYGRRD